MIIISKRTGWMEELMPGVKANWAGSTGPVFETHLGVPVPFPLIPTLTHHSSIYFTNRCSHTSILSIKWWMSSFPRPFPFFGSIVFVKFICHTSFSQISYCSLKKKHDRSHMWPPLTPKHNTHIHSKGVLEGCRSSGQALLGCDRLAWPAGGILVHNFIKIWKAICR